MKLVISGFSPEYSVPRYYGYSYTDWNREDIFFYPLPINYIVRYWKRLRWSFLTACYQVGIIDTGEAEAFRWEDFYRIKVH